MRQIRKFFTKLLDVLKLDMFKCVFKSNCLCKNDCDFNNTDNIKN